MVHCCCQVRLCVVEWFEILMHVLHELIRAECCSGWRYNTTWHDHHVRTPETDIGKQLLPILRSHNNNTQIREELLPGVLPLLYGLQRHKEPGCL